MRKKHKLMNEFLKNESDNDNADGKLIKINVIMSTLLSFIPFSMLFSSLIIKKAQEKNHFLLVFSPL